jgi:hypothetical protein
MAMRVTPKSLWDRCRHMPVSEVAREYGMTTQALVGLFRTAGLLGEGEAKDPGPSELERRREEVRRRWNLETEQRRWIGARAVRDRLPG